MYKKNKNKQKLKQQIIFDNTPRTLAKAMKFDNGHQNQ